MAPKRKTPAASTKTPAASTKTTSAKRSKVEKPIEKEPEKTPEELNLETLKEALLNEDYPVAGLPSNRKLLVDVAPFCLAETVEERHQYQNEMVKCVDESIEAIHTHLKAEVTKQEEVEASAEETRARLAGEQEAAQTTLDAMIEDLDAKTTTAREAKDALKEAEAEVKAAQEDQENIEEDLSTQEERKEELRVAEEELYGSMKEAKADKKSLKKLTSVLDTMKLDGSFLKALPDALDKDLDARGMFDNMALKYLDEQFTTQRASVDTEIETTTATVESKKAVTTEKEAARDASAAAKEAADAAKDEAAEAKKSAAAALKDCEKAVKAHEKDVKEASTLKAEAEEDVLEFQTVLTAFHALRDRSSAPPAEEPAAVEEQVVTAEEVSDEAAPAPAEEEVEAAPAEALVETAPVEEQPVEEQPVVEELPAKAIEESGEAMQVEAFGM